MNKKELLELMYQDFQAKKPTYDKMYQYYKGQTDATEDYKMITSRSDTVINVNFLKKFVLEEVSYSIGNDINYTYSGEKDSKEVLEDIRYYMAHIPADHDVDLFKDMLIYSFSYELYSFDNNGDFNMHVLTPDEAYLYQDASGNPKYFMHVYNEQFTDEVRIKVYDDEYIYYYNEDFETTATRKKHKFTGVPVGVARVSDELEHNSLYNDIKGLQDAYETNLSDISNEISDFRNAYLTLTGVQLEDGDDARMKANGIMHFRNDDAKAAWLIKDINDSFIQNTLSTIEEKLYQVSSHINYNEKMDSNSSSLALKARMISLESKCRLNEKAFSNALQTRIKFLFEYIEFVANKAYKGDFRNVGVKYTPNMPSDELMIAQRINLLSDTLSLQTRLSMIPEVEDPEVEIKRMEEEEHQMYGSDLPSLENILAGGADE